MKIKDNLYKIVNNAMLGVGAFTLPVLVSNHLLAKSEMADYNYFTGHVGSYALAMTATAFMNKNVRPDNIMGQAFYAAYFGGAFTFMEMMEKNSYFGMTYDPQDIAFIWAGALSALMISVVAGGVQQHTLEERLEER